MPKPKSIDRAAYIRWPERDINLGLEVEAWPQPEDVPSTSWTPELPTSTRDGYLHRTIDMRPKGAKGPPRPAEQLWEAILRLPNAPIYGVNRVHDHRVKLATASHHTVRVLALGSGRPKRVRRIYLLQNGLNEIEKQSFYYDFALRLLAEKPDAVCIITPFPAHLSRFPFQGAYAQRPLDRYLEDSGDLFRAFLRHMVETRWLLSCVTPRPWYALSSGATLLASDTDPRRSRLSSRALGTALSKEFASLQDASRVQLSRAVPGRASDQLDVGMQLGPEHVRRCVRGLRQVLRLRMEPAEVGPPTPDGGVLEPEVHVIGYSLGGFVAQSIFMTWPFVVSSCSTICSGGALRELSPSAFAHPEEWQTVMHSLRYQLEDAMMEGRIRRERDGTTGGLDKRLFGFLSRVFYEVFEQEIRGTYQSHIGEYTRRLLFVVGGNDPIVRPQSVLDSAPKEGVNLLSIAKLTHFLGSRPTDDIEQQQRSFWIPEIARIIARFGSDAADAHGHDLRAGWLRSDLATPHFPEASGVGGDDLRSSTFVRPADGALASPQFEQYMDLLCHHLEAGEGWLFILRNDIPTALLRKDIVRWRGSALHHADRPIIRYITGVERRHTALTLNARRTIVLPADIKRRFLASGSDFPPNSDATVGLLPGALDLGSAWAEFHDQWLASDRDVRVFHAGKLDGRSPKLARSYASSILGELEERGKGSITMTSLPDCWLWVSTNVLGSVRDKRPEDAAEKLVIKLAIDAAKGDDTEDVTRHIRDGDLKLLVVSGAKFNPRYRGKIVTDPKEAQKTILHSALALAFSQPASDASGLR